MPLAVRSIAQVSSISIITYLYLDSSPLRYLSSSSPNRRANSQTQTRSGLPSSALFLNSDLDGRPPGSSVPQPNRRGDIHSDLQGASGQRRRRLFVDENGVPVPSSDAPTFSQLDPNTSDAQAMGGDSTRVIWGTNVSIQDTMSAFKNFLMHYTKKYRMWADGATNADTEAQPEIANQKEYVDMMRNMRLLGVGALNLDLRNLKSYPATAKLWQQLQFYPQEVIPIMDQTIKDLMVEEAEKEVKEINRTQQQPHAAGIASSDPAFPSSDQPEPQSRATGSAYDLRQAQDILSDVETRIFKTRPFGLDTSINLRELNPAGTSSTFSRNIVLTSTRYG